MKPWVRDLAETILLTALIFLLVRSVIQNYRVDGRSMEPTLESGQLLLVNKAVYWRLEGELARRLFPRVAATDEGSIYLFQQPQRGDVIVFRYPRDPNRDFIKRVIAVPGDTVEVRRGRVYLNGAPLREAYIADQPTYTSPPQVVSPGQFFVLGDNRNNSSDSHVWGLVPEDHIVGRAWLSYWPIEHWGVVPGSALATSADR